MFKTVYLPGFKYKGLYLLCFPPLFLASQCSPVIRKIRTDCAGEFSAFESCLRENQSSAEACQPHLARFLACVETVDLSGIGKQWSMCVYIKLKSDMQLEFITEITMHLNIYKTFFSNSKCCASAHIDVFAIVLSNEDNSRGALYSIILGRNGLWKYYIWRTATDAQEQEQT